MNENNSNTILVRNALQEGVIHPKQAFALLADLGSALNETSVLRNKDRKKHLDEYRHSLSTNSKGFVVNGLLDLCNASNEIISWSNGVENNEEIEAGALMKMGKNNLPQEQFIWGQVWKRQARFPTNASIAAHVANPSSSSYLNNNTYVAAANNTAASSYSLTNNNNLSTATNTNNHANMNSTVASSTLNAVSNSSSLVGNNTKTTRTQETAAVKKKPRGYNKMLAAASAAVGAELQPVTYGGPGRPGKKMKSVHNSDSEEDMLYCTCKSPWREDKAVEMIGCDGGCEGWFHPQCLGYQRMEKKGASVLLVDIEGNSIDATSNFLCPVCELTSTTPLPLAFRFNARQLLRLCDVVDILDDANKNEEEWITENGKINQHRAYATQWKEIAKARSATPKLTVVCATCEEIHHPRLPCAVMMASSENEQPQGAIVLPVERQQMERTSADVPYALIVSGRYQGKLGMLPGGEAEIRKGFHQIFLLDDIVKTELIIPEERLLLFNTSQRVWKTEETFHFLGVRVVDENTFQARLPLPSGKYIPLGNLPSAIQAARVHDVAALLQFGNEASLNFTEAIAGKGRNDEIGAWLKKLIDGPNQGGSRREQSFMRDPLDVTDWVETLMEEWNYISFEDVSKESAELINACKARLKKMLWIVQPCVHFNSMGIMKVLKQVEIYPNWAGYESCEDVQAALKRTRGGKKKKIVF